MVRQGLVLGIAVLGLAALARAGQVTIEEAYPGSRLRPGSPGNPYELHERGQPRREIEEYIPGSAAPGSYTNPWVVRPGQNLERWNGREMLSPPDDDEDEGDDE